MDQEKTRPSFACRFCIALYGLSGKDLTLLPQERQVIERHVEAAHAYLIPQAHESEEQARFRFMSTYGQEPVSAQTVLASLRALAPIVASLIEEKGAVIPVAALNLSLQQ